MRQLMALLGGICIATYMPSMPSVGMLGLLLLLSVLLLFGSAKMKPSVCRTSVRCLAAGLAAFSLFLLRADLSLQAQWPSELDGRTLRLHIQIEREPMASDKAWRFDARITSLAFAGGQQGADTVWKHVNGKRIRLRLYRSTAQRYLLSPDANAKTFKQLQSELGLHAGRTLTADIKLKAPRGLHNFGAQDFQARMLSQSIIATGYVKTLHSVNGSARYGLREQLSLDVDNIKLKHGPLLKGLLLGDRRDLNAEHWSLLQQTGTGHLLAISGLHIGLSAALGMLISGLAGRGAQLFSEAVPSAQTVALWGGGLTAVAYAWLADFSLPTQRALLMLWLFLLAAMMARPLVPWRVLSIVLLLLLFFDPWALEQAGGCLSFAAVAALIYGYRCYRKPPGGMATYGWQLFRSQWLLASFLGIVLYSLQLPSGSLSLPANLLAIPWLSFVIMPLLLLFCLSWLLGLDWHWPLHWADGAMDILWRYLQSLLAMRDRLLVDVSDYLDAYFGIASNSTQVALWWPAIPVSVGPILLMLLAALLFWLPKGFHGRLLCMLPLLCLCFPSSLVQPKAEALQLTIVDVGQGLAVLIEKGSRAVLYDVGPRYSAEHNAGARVVAPFLRGRGIRELDHLIVSHGDSDHSGGLNSVLEQFTVGTLWSESQYLQTIQDQVEGLSVSESQVCVKGKAWQWQGIQFEWLWPAPIIEQHSTATKNNNRSCVLLIQYEQLRLLLPGDIERWAEQQILNDVSMTSKLCALDVLLLAHHGSHSSSHKAWADCTRPAMVISSTAWQNAYGHPSPKVLRRYPFSVQLDTGRDGAIQLRYERNKLGQMVLKRLLKSRQQQPRYWHHKD
ncbi:DNA internalization-related competence protein ComEC/Rec2 [Pseudoteredinibacter isoporae]|uniref:DNA internalization-related competence protein ComEC/Rec2 n=1 Tax=Pseudoteredinibacter isoporae TaxID=570281 RepID=UPI003107E037